MNNHIVVDGETGMIRCRICGEEKPLDILLPVSLKTFVSIAKEFEGRHSNCEPSIKNWTETTEL